MDKFVITKKIAKHGDNTIVVIPKFLQPVLRHKRVCKITFEVLDSMEGQ